MGHGGEFWQNMVHWRRKWQTTSSFLLGNPMSSMKRQKDMTLNVPCPRLGRVQYATERDQRNSSRRNKEAEPKQKQCPVVDMCGDECKVWYCKEQYCIGTWNVRSLNKGKLEVVKQEMARVNINILGNNKLKWTRIGKFNSDNHYIYYCRQESLRRNGVALIVNRRVRNAVLECSLQNDRWSLFLSKANHSISQ